jgi:hypothetical protein
LGRFFTHMREEPPEADTDPEDTDPDDDDMTTADNK